MTRFEEKLEILKKINELENEQDRVAFADMLFNDTCSLTKLEYKIWQKKEIQDTKWRMNHENKRAS